MELVPLPQAPDPALCIASVGLWLTWILHNKSVITVTVPLVNSVISLVNYGNRRVEIYIPVSQKCGWPGHPTVAGL